VVPFTASTNGSTRAACKVVVIKEVGMRDGNPVAAHNVLRRFNQLKD
jgi:hypothetical protein